MLRCAILFVLILLFLPETKGYTLEELDQVFSVPTGTHAKYQVYNLGWHFRKYVLRKDEPQRQLYTFDEDSTPSEEERQRDKELRTGYAAQPAGQAAMA